MSRQLCLKESREACAQGFCILCLQGKHLTTFLWRHAGEGLVFALDDGKDRFLYQLSSCVCEGDQHPAPSAASQGQIAALLQIPDGGVDRLLGDTGCGADILLLAAVPVLAEMVEDVKGAVRKPQMERRIVIQLVDLLLVSVKLGEVCAHGRRGRRKLLFFHIQGYSLVKSDFVLKEV